MGLQEQLVEEMKAAMKGGDTLRLSVIRLLRAAVKNREIERRRPLTDAEVRELAASQVKQRKEAIALFAKGGREDLAARERAEIQILEGYLPPSLSQEALQELIRTVIAETGASGPKDFGKVMKALMPQVAGRAEGQVVGDLVRALLGEGPGH
jgi:uncharacterized protein YqeY